VFILANAHVFGADCRRFGSPRSLIELKESIRTAILRGNHNWCEASESIVQKDDEAVEKADPVPFNDVRPTTGFVKAL